MTDSEKRVLTNCAENLGVSLDTVAADFAKFNAEIDRLIEEEGLYEHEAINKVLSYWEFPKAV